MRNVDRTESGSYASSDADDDDGPVAES
jgi:hypothetical protein